MNDLQATVETRRVNSSKDVPVDIARDLKRRLEAGKALVISERPAVALSVICKSWARLKRETALDKARTLDRRRHEDLDAQLMIMEWTDFTATRLDRFADVYIVEPPNAASLADQVATIYVATPLSDSKLKALLRKVEPDTLFIHYEVDNKAD